MATNRRRFLQMTTASIAAAVVPRHVLGGPGYVAPSERVNVALVGAGGQGRTNIRGILKHDDARVIAVADPIEQEDLSRFYFKGLAGRRPVQAEIEKHYRQQQPEFQCAVYEDFRKMLDREKSIDAVLCATPDHLHAYVSITSMLAGKHVYCEKPLTHNVWEARQVAAVAKQTGVATQMGNQGHSTVGMRWTCEWLWDGVIGTVREVHAWVGTRRWNPTLMGLPEDPPTVPTGVNWDLWLGPRQPHPYHPAYTPVTWRDFWVFGTGAMGDFGCHDLDAACWALDLHTPTSVEARPAGYTDAEIAPHGEICYYTFPARGKNPPVTVTWYDGGLQPPCPAELGPRGTLPSRGVLFIGDKGKMLCGGAGGAPRLLPYEKTADYTKPAESLPRSNGHHRDWLDACKGGTPASSNFEYGSRLTEIVLLAVASQRLGKKLYWDAAQMKVTNVASADAIVKESYRPGWEIPAATSSLP